METNAAASTMAGKKLQDYGRIEKCSNSYVAPQETNATSDSKMWTDFTDSGCILLSVDQLAAKITHFSQQQQQQ